MARILLGAAQVEGDGMRGFEVGERYVLVARVGGAWRAIEDLCNHAGCLLSWGRREADSAVCPCHGVAFDLATGKNLNAPKICGDQRVLSVEEESGQLYLITSD